MANTYDTLKNNRNLSNAYELLEKAVRGNRAFKMKNDDMSDRYYLWNADQNEFSEVTLQAGGRYSVTDSSDQKLRDGLEARYKLENQDEIQQLEKQKEEPSLLDNFLGFFGFKTERIERNERIDKVLEHKRDAYVRNNMKKAGFKNDLMPAELSDEDKKVAELTGDALMTYVQKGDKPSAPTRDDSKRDPYYVAKEGMKKSNFRNEFEKKVNMLRENAPLIDTLYDHLKTSIEYDKDMNPIEKFRATAAAGVMCKYYNDKMISLRDNKDDPFTEKDADHLGYLSECSSKTLLDVCKQVSEKLPTEIEEKETVFNVNINVTEIAEQAFFNDPDPANNEYENPASEFFKKKELFPNRISNFQPKI